MIGSRALLGLIAGLAAAALAACSGGGPAAVAPAASGPAPASAMLQVSIPTAGTQSAQRLPQFLSSASASLTVVATSTAGSYTSSVAVSSGSPGCTDTGVARVCNVPVASPVGNVVFDVTAADASANQLGHGASAGVNVQPGVAVQVPPIVLGVIPATVSFAETSGALRYQSASSAALNVATADNSSAHLPVPAISAAFVFNSGTVPAPVWGNVTFAVTQNTQNPLAAITFSSNGSCPGTASATMATAADTMTICSSGVNALGTIVSVTGSWNGGAVSASHGVHFNNIPPGAVTPSTYTNVVSPETIVAASDLTRGTIPNADKFALASSSSIATYVFAGAAGAGASTKCALPVRLVTSSNAHVALTLNTGGTRWYAGGVDGGGVARLYEVFASNCTTLTLPVASATLPVVGIATDSANALFYAYTNGAGQGGVAYAASAGIQTSDFSAASLSSVTVTGSMLNPASIVYSPKDGVFVVGGKGGTANEGQVQSINPSTLAVSTMTLPNFPSGADVALTVSRYNGAVFGISANTTIPAVYAVDAGGFFGNALVSNGVLPALLLYQYTNGSTTAYGPAVFPGAKMLVHAGDGSLYVVAQTGGSPSIDRISNLQGATRSFQSGVANVLGSPAGVPFLLPAPLTNQLIWIDSNSQSNLWPSI